MGLPGLCSYAGWTHTECVIVILQLILIAGLAGFAGRLFLGVRARRRSKTAGRMMARTLRTSVRNQNAQQAIAALREKRDIEIQPLESAMASRADLCQRIEGIRLRVLARTAGTSPTVAEGGRAADGGFGVPVRSLYNLSGMVDRRLVGHPG
jgi:hypothetical protein